jgi:sterol 24-C-methyltransferase
MRSIKACRTALETVGFEIEQDKDLADVGDKIPWYYPLAGDLRACQTVWDVAMCWR